MKLERFWSNLEPKNVKTSFIFDLCIKQAPIILKLHKKRNKAVAVNKIFPSKTSKKFWKATNLLIIILDPENKRH